MFNSGKFITCISIFLCLFCVGSALAEGKNQCLNATPDSDCFQDLILDVGGSVVIDIDKPTKQMKFVTSNDKIIEVRPFKEDKLYVRGKEVGHGTLTVYDQTNGKTVAKIEIIVKPLTTVSELTNLKRQFVKNFPGQNINVEATQKGIVLTGTVTGAEIVEQVLRLAEGYLSSISEGVVTSDKKVITLPGGQTVIENDEGSTRTGRSGKKIINMLKVEGPQQVLLEVKFAEVNRNSMKDFQAGFSLADLGHNISAGYSSNRAVNTGSTDSSLLGSVIKGTNSLLGNIPLAPNIFIDDPNNFALFLRFVEEESLGRVLAEPKLVTMTGQEASFLAGGEYPYQTIDENGQTKIEFKDYGVGLKFTPVVGSDGMITIKVAPSVTDISDVIETSTGPQAIFSTRKLESMVQLRDGQTLSLAGLLSDSLTENVSKVPLLGDIPILGALFRSTDFQHKKTDLLIAVTPHLVNPVHEEQINFPGEFISPPNRFELYLEGKLEGRRSSDEQSLLSKHAFMTPVSAKGGGLEGSFGHMEPSK